MTPEYIKQTKAINELALILATDGYTVDTTFYSNHCGIQLIVFFSHQYLRKKIEHLLKQYASDDDKIRFRTHAIGINSKFYTLTLYKNPL